jgi:hypothetical protein
MRKKVRIDCYLSLHCGSEHELRKIILKALEMEGLQARVNIFRVDDVKAVKMGLRGSPFLFIDGRAFQPIEMSGFS